MNTFNIFFRMADRHNTDPGYLIPSLRVLRYLWNMTVRNLLIEPVNGVLPCVFFTVESGP
jgi:hypothetical protein